MIANLSTATVMSLLATLGPADGVVNNFSNGVGVAAEGEDADNVALKKNKTINVDKPGEFLVLMFVRCSCSAVTPVSKRVNTRRDS